MRPRFLMLAALFLSTLASHAAVGQPYAPFVPREFPPERVWREYHAVDGPNGSVRMLAHDWRLRGDVDWGDWTTFDPPARCEIPEASSRVRGLSPVNGSTIWEVNVGNWHKTQGPVVPPPGCIRHRHWAPIRLGWPQPHYPTGLERLGENLFVPVDNVQPTRDLNGDGVGDFLAYGWTRSSVTPPIEYRGQLALYSGTNGSVLWSRPLTAELTISPGYEDIYRLVDFPTGLLYYEGPAGPRFAWKTTNWTFSYTLHMGVIAERFQVGDAASGTMLWQHEQWNRTGDQDFISTYLTGAAQLDGDDELELVWDRWAARGRILDAGALRGDLDIRTELLNVTRILEDPVSTVDPYRSPRVLWGPSRCHAAPTTSADPKQLEDDVPLVSLHHVQVVGDVTGDARPDVVCKYLTTKGGVSSNNGRWETHIQPLSGADGHRLWPKQDIRQQGYGFVADLNEPPTFRQESWGSIPLAFPTEPGHRLLALGTVDLREDVPRGASFPPKDTRLTVIKTTDGAPKWGPEAEPFAQDSFLIQDLALKQFATALTVADMTGDGVRELISAPRYPYYGPEEQVLYASTRFHLFIVDGNKGNVLQTLEPWGPQGIVLPCPGAATDHVAVLSGHPRRWDVTFLDLRRARTAERHALYINPVPQAMVLGSEVLGLAGRCRATSQDVHVGFTKALLGPRRGSQSEFVTPVGTFGAEHEWVLPSLPYDPPLNATLAAFSDATRGSLDPGTDPVVSTTVSVAAGIALSLGHAAWLGRRARRGSP